MLESRAATTVSAKPKRTRGEEGIHYMFLKEQKSLCRRNGITQEHSVSSGGVEGYGTARKEV